MITPEEDDDDVEELPNFERLQPLWEPDYINDCLHGRRAASSSKRECLCLGPVTSPVVFPPHWAHLRNNEAFCDGLVHCNDGKTFKVNRTLLAAVSPYFMILFNNPLNCNQPEINTATIDAPGYIFSKMMDYAYTGQIHIDTNSVASLMQYADQYEMLGIMRLAAQFILEWKRSLESSNFAISRFHSLTPNALDHMNPTNCMDLFFRCGRQYFCNHLEDRGFDYVRRHFTEVVRQSTDLHPLSVEDMIDLLTDDRLNVSSEMIACEAVVKWREYDHSRMQHLTTLFRSIRIGCLPDLIQFANWPLNGALQDLIRSVERAPNKQGWNSFAIVSHLHYRPRYPDDIVFVIGGCNGDHHIRFIETFDNRAKRWLQYMHRAVTRCCHGVCTLDGIIYVIGGYDGDKHHSTTLAFDPETHTLRNRACMHERRSNVSVATHSGKIYAMGGINEHKCLKSVERYDPTLNQWELVQPMLQQRSNAGAACVNDKIYIVGGYSGTRTVLSSSEIYDADLNQWSYGPAMSTARASFALVHLRGTLFALGGCNGSVTLRTAERITPNIWNATWRPITSMLNSRSYFCAVVLERRILAIGGDDGTSVVGHVESYNMDKDAWKTMPSMDICRANASACVVSGLKNRMTYSLVGNLKQCMNIIEEIS